MTAHLCSRSLKVLHVDDDPVNLIVMQHLLEALGHRATGVASAADALRRLHEERFEAVLTDIHMPDIGGVELLDRLQDSNSPPPVIAVTADVMTRTAEDFERLGFTGAVAKPLLLGAIEQALENAGRPPGRRRFAASGLAHA